MTQPFYHLPLSVLLLSGLGGLAPELVSPVLAQTAPAQPAPAQPLSTQNPPSSGSGIPSLDANLRQDIGRYLLGAGDRIKVNVFDVEELSGEQQVLPDGTVTLPLIGSVNVEGMSLEAAAGRLAQLLSPYLVRNIVNVSLVSPRPLTVAIVGEVNRPGSYTLNFNQDSRGSSGTNGAIGGIGGVQGGANATTLTGALQTAGGITALANVRQIQVSRVVASGGRRTFEINLWDLMKGDISQDVRLFDGDSINIPRATTLTAQESTEIAGASFSPATINVQVVGEVVKPGNVTIRPNAPFTEAVVAAGSITNDGDWRRVELYRLEPDGRISRRTLRADLNQPLNEQSNPPLRSRDVIVVRPSFGSSILRGISTFGNALSGVVNPIFLFDRITDLGK
ncbi:polysaccharide biosynthesis/export family protein [Leptolyngbya sp. FACHB-261]|uniref:polysaccharide biosynthesis/export family protein n=1 Tax=Leptolyngbya sp. FACHB-261 TaxID=2692806 RepID=UPI00168642C4|nr:polysaccharide biosynthesis/export family protein [Leptolyngbya sp. FACHB-261]MBD2104256.1 SLBB domain-containing protein [Leptolyngbya sp. FACHB-261]